MDPSRGERWSDQMAILRIFIFRETRRRPKERPPSISRSHRREALFSFYDHFFSFSLSLLPFFLFLIFSSSSSSSSSLSTVSTSFLDAMETSSVDSASLSFYLFYFTFSAVNWPTVPEPHLVSTVQKEKSDKKQSQPNKKLILKRRKESVILLFGQLGVSRRHTRLPLATALVYCR